MATETEIQLFARIRAHEILIQNLLRLVFKSPSGERRLVVMPWLADSAR